MDKSIVNRIGSACWYRIYDSKACKFGAWTSGILRLWSTDYIKCDNGCYQFPVCVVEDEKSGRCISVPVHGICFAAIPND